MRWRPRRNLENQSAGQFSALSACFLWLCGGAVVHFTVMRLRTFDRLVSASQSRGGAAPLARSLSRRRYRHLGNSVPPPPTSLPRRDPADLAEVRTSATCRRRRGDSRRPFCVRTSPQISAETGLLTRLSELLPLSTPTSGDPDSEPRECWRWRDGLFPPLTHFLAASSQRGDGLCVFDSCLRLPGPPVLRLRVSAFKGRLEKCRR